MSSRWRLLAVILLVGFGFLLIGRQFLHRDDPHASCIAGAFATANHLGAITNIVDRDRYVAQPGGVARQVNLELPEKSRVFMADMNGPENKGKIGIYFFMTYYLFPREVMVSLDKPAFMTANGFVGTNGVSDDEIRARHIDLKVSVDPDGITRFFVPPDVQLKKAFNPDWFFGYSDTTTAFLIPLLTALAGMWLLRFLFPALNERMSVIEQLACGLGLGMMGLAAATLGLKLCGFHGYHILFALLIICALAELWRDRAVFRAALGDYRVLANLLVIAGAAVFLLLFRLAHLEGLVEYDAVMAWALKAKIIHLYTGNELVQWFSSQRLAHAHLDYPTLVPSLHAATYDALGHVDEFVTKFWPVWMLLLLLGTLASLNSNPKQKRRWFHAPYFGLLGALLLPATLQYAQMEGGTMPMIFFTVLGFVQCAIGLAGQDQLRLGLGLVFLFGAAMAKFEGFIFLGVAAICVLLLPFARRLLKISSTIWRLAFFCALAALPFVWLRLHITAQHYESGWTGYALHNPGATLSRWPVMFMIMLVRWFLNPEFANWNVEGSHFQWAGHWVGFDSFYNESSMGLSWVCLGLTTVVWFGLPSRRQIVVWILATLAGVTLALSGLFAVLANVTSLEQIMGSNAEVSAGRYLLPMLLAWFATMMTLLFRDGQPSQSERPKSSSAPAFSSASKRQKKNQFASKSGGTR